MWYSDSKESAKWYRRFQFRSQENPSTKESRLQRDVNMQYGEDADYGLSSTGKDAEEEYVDDASTSTRQHETLYCFCHQKATEDMICCDDENCPYKWFHYKCVGIDPSCITDGSWYCPLCKEKHPDSFGVYYLSKNYGINNRISF